jgi:exocyst complex protein 7
VELAPLPNQALGPTYNTLLTPLLTLFSNTLSSLISLIKRSLHKYTFLALSSFESLSSLQPRWDELLQRCGTDARRETNELKDGLQSLRSVCLRSFPEFLADVKVAAISKGGDTSTGLADFTLTVCLFILDFDLRVSSRSSRFKSVQYMERIPDVGQAVGSALLSLGDGNWRMGYGMPVAKSNLGPGDEPIIIEHFTCMLPSFLLLLDLCRR